MSRAPNDFAEYIDDVIVHVAEMQTGSTTSPVDLRALHLLHFKTSPETWAELAARHMQDQGFGRDHSTFDGHWFSIDGGGLARAAEIRASRRPRTPLERIKAVPRSDWIALAALIVSAIALLK